MPRGNQTGFNLIILHFNICGNFNIVFLSQECYVCLSVPRMLCLSVCPKILYPSLCYNCLIICPKNFLSVYLSKECYICLSISEKLYLSVCPNNVMSVCLSQEFYVCLSVQRMLYLSVPKMLCQSVCPKTVMSVCLSQECYVYLSFQRIFLSVCLYQKYHFCSNTFMSVPRILCMS